MPNRSTRKRLQLPLWSECIDVYGGMFRDQNITCVKLGGFVIQFDDASRQARAVQEALEEVRIGSMVGLLRTDSLESPLRVRIVSSKMTTGVNRFKASRVGKGEGEDDSDPPNHVSRESIERENVSNEELVTSNSNQLYLCASIGFLS